MRLTTQTPQNNSVLNRILDEDIFFGLPWAQAQQNAFYPALDVLEEKDQYVLRADIPGLNKEDIKVSVENGILTLEGERKFETEHKDVQFHCMERSYGRFVRSLNLGPGVDSSKISASYKDGILKLVVPKLEAAKPKSIDIKVE
jgi:HSP20 family protein